MTSERGYQLVSQELLRLAALAINEVGVVTLRTTLGADELEAAFRTAQMLNVLSRRHENVDQALSAARSRCS